jgi:hypothetical protein
MSTVPGWSPLSRSDRNNNPGNLRATPWTRSQPGYIGSDGAFARFDTPNAGLMAMQTLLGGGSYIGGQRDTIRSIMAAYSPVKDPGNAPGSTANYVSRVAALTGLHPDQPLSRDDIPQLTSAMSMVEAGHAAPMGVIPVQQAPMPTVAEQAAAGAQARFGSGYGPSPPGSLAGAGDPGLTRVAGLGPGSVPGLTPGPDLGPGLDTVPEAGDPFAPSQ